MLGGTGEIQSLGITGGLSNFGRGDAACRNCGCAPDRLAIGEIDHAQVRTRAGERVERRVANLAPAEVEDGEVRATLGQGAHGVVANFARALEIEAAEQRAMHRHRVHRLGGDLCAEAQVERGEARARGGEQADARVAHGVAHP